MSNQSYLPRADIDLLQWSQTLAWGVAASYAQLGLSEADSASLSSAVARFESAYHIATTPHTRTTPAILQKDAMRAELAATARAIVRRIQTFPGASDEQKSALSIRIHKKKPSHIAAPTTQPLLSLAWTSGFEQALRIGDEASSTRRALPENVTAAEVYACFEPNLPPFPQGWQMMGLATRATLRISHRWSDAGKVVALIARWVNRKGEHGPFGDVIYARVAAVGARAA